MKVLFHLMYVNCIQRKIEIILKLRLFLEWIQCWNRVKVKPSFHDNWIWVLYFLFDVTSHQKILQALCMEHLSNINILILHFFCFSAVVIIHFHINFLEGKPEESKLFYTMQFFLNKGNHEESFPPSSNDAMLQWQSHCCCLLQEGILNKAQEEGQFLDNSSGTVDMYVCTDSCQSHHQLMICFWLVNFFKHDLIAESKQEKFSRSDQSWQAFI